MTYTKIEWADMVWNPVTGCTPVSEGCQNCYARRIAQRLRGRFGYPADDPFRITLHPERLGEPLSLMKPHRIFVCSMGDLFHEAVPLAFIADVFNIMASATAECGKRHRHTKECWTGNPHIFLILTKRPQRMKQVIEKLPDWVGEYWPGDAPLSVALEVGHWPLPNVWLGVSVENQAAAEERIPILLQIPAAVRFVSCEPMLGPIRLERDWLRCPGGAEYGHGMSLTTVHAGGCCKRHPKIDWIIVGGESGPGARPMHPDWVRSLRDQCQAAGVPFFFKSWGEWIPHDGC